jgi:hypothetical protein
MAERIELALEAPTAARPDELGIFHVGVNRNVDA